MQLAILILAAGSSSRMGRPKQLLPWGNTTLLGEAINTAKSIKTATTYVVLGANYDQIKKTIENDFIQIIYNDNWELGLGSSIAKGIKNLSYSYDGVLIMLADQPLVNKTHLTALIKAFEDDNQHIVATDYATGRLGVPAIFDHCYFEELSQFTEDKGAKQLIDNNAKNVTALKAEHLIIDIDTEEGYKRLYNDYH